MPFSEEAYGRIKEEVISYLSERRLYLVHGIAGADRHFSRKILAICEMASQALFVRQMLVRPTEKELEGFDTADFVVMAAPNLKLSPKIHDTNSEAAVLINFKERIVLVVGTQYSGEIKKSIFSVMNYLLPVEDDVLTMHCSCNMNPRSHGTTVFFGLSGTGKTTLSAAEDRMLIGDDEHGWSQKSVFNIEGGCYAKTINIKRETEPQIWDAIRFGSMCENVVIDPVTRLADYDDDSITENGRVAYPVEFIDNAAAYQALLEQLAARSHAAQAGGGEAACASQRARNKLLPRERVNALLDPGTPFMELAQLAGDGMYDGAAPSAGWWRRRRPVGGARWWRA